VGYDDARFEQDCQADPQSDMMCPGHIMIHHDTVVSHLPREINLGFEEPSFDGQDDGQMPPPQSINQGYEEPVFHEPMFHEPMHVTHQEIFHEPMREEVFHEPQHEEVFHEPMREEVFHEPLVRISEVEDPLPRPETRRLERPVSVIEDEEEVVEESSIEEPIEEPTTGQRRERRTNAKAIVAQQTRDLLSNLQEQSINSGQTTSGSTGSGFYSSDDSMFASLSSGGISHTSIETTVVSTNVETATTRSNDVETISNLNLDLNLTVGISVNLNNQTNMVKVETRKKTLAERLSESVAKQNSENQTGVFSNQAQMLDKIATATNFTAYYSETLSDADTFYVSKQIYERNRLIENQNSLWRMMNQSSGLHYELVRSQYNGE